MLNFNKDFKLTLIYSGYSDLVNILHITKTLENCELILVTEGTLYITQEGKKYELHKGDYLFCKKGVEFGGYKEATSKFQWLHFEYDENEVLFSDDSNSNYAYNLEEFGNIKNMEPIIIEFNLLHQASAKPYKQNVSNELAKAIIFDIYSEVSNIKNKDDVKDKHFQTVLEYFEINPYLNEFTDVKSMAKFFNYSEKYLIRLFKKRTGMSPLQYFIEKKMIRAQELLANETLTVKQIASYLNYDYYYFIRLFKSKTGLSPLKYRNMISPSIIRQN